MSSLIESYARFVLRHRLALMVASLVLLVVSVYMIATRFSLAQNLKDDLPPDDPQIVAFNEFLHQFGDAELMVVALEAPDVFTHDVLTYLDRLTKRIEKIDNIEQTLSLTNAMEIRGIEGTLEVKPFLPETGVPSQAQALADLRRRALDNDFWVNAIVSESGNACAINMKLAIFTDDATFRFGVVSAVQAVLDAEAPPPGVGVHFTGVSVFGRDSIRAMNADLKNYVWLMPVLVLVLLFVVFRTLRGVLIPQVVITFSVCYTLALLFATGKSITMISTMLPVLIGVIAISDVIHVIARYYELSQTIHDRMELVRATLVHMLPPCFLSSTTTAAGFAALMVSDLTQVRDFGLFAAIGLMLAFFTSMVLTPIILSFLPVPQSRLRQAYKQGFFSRLLNAIDRFVARDRFIIAVLSVALMLLAISGIAHLKVETRVSKFLPQDAPSVVDLYWLQENMAGVSSLEMTLKGEPGVFKEPWALDEVEKLQNYLQSLPEVDKAFSMVDFIRTFNRVLHDEDPAFNKIPETRQAVAQYLLLFEMTGRTDLLTSFINGDYSYTRLSARIVSLGSQGHLDLIRHIQDYADRRIDKRLRFQTTGVVVLYATITTALVNGQIYSLIIAFFVITVMMTLHLRSIRIGLLSMIPNLLPIAITLGMMGALEITLNVATVMIACIALGIAVDDTIHYLSRYRFELDAGQKRADAMHTTIMGAGRGMIYTSLVITGGFCVLTFSSFHTNRAFGLLTAITMVTAVFADLIVLPYLVRVLKVDR